MAGPTPVSDPPYRTTLDLAMAAHRSPRRILKDLKRGAILADRPGHEYLFTPDQFKRALQHYREQPGGQHGANGGDHD